MMKNRNKLGAAIGFALVGLVFSCGDVFLTDITEDTIELSAPSDSLQTQQTSHVYWWRELPGATAYELVIVSPDLQTTDVLALDTVITQTSFNFELLPGKYQWCVRGVNAGYESRYSCRNLEILN